MTVNKTPPPRGSLSGSEFGGLTVSTYAIFTGDPEGDEWGDATPLGVLGPSTFDRRTGELSFNYYLTRGGRHDTLYESIPGRRPGHYQPLTSSGVSLYELSAQGFVVDDSSSVIFGYQKNLNENSSSYASRIARMSAVGLWLAMHNIDSISRTPNSRIPLAPIGSELAKLPEHIRDQMRTAGNGHLVVKS